MAKSARSSNTKRNNRNLRAKVFGPAENARTARLSAKLQELAAKPRPIQDKAMDVDEPVEQGEQDQSNGNTNSEDMDIDGLQAKVVKPKVDHKQRRKEHRVSKKKPRNQMVFSSERARKAKQALKKSKR
ncbi:uncharacterized protein A1O9_03153 [Exophiala aquamarina CBS 119918]|uniref:DUF2423 domain-containing protein n=1 Tax=Exophiala aquamarina CBS 119918 TaxID=1182545 RepID=A0A072Q103_9EURO|nr:uncharacterized protein A1O9_03153 [Exophiala aquamarina CBS 119918]KEF61585.1 hypothetical protein A1O9_03153 [Exophiala aquamarina CBS 119918]